MKYKVNRRSFFGVLGLGAGASLLGPIYDALIREAHGAPLERKAVVFMMNGQGNYLKAFTPVEAQVQPGFDRGGCGRQTTLPGELPPGTFSWPAAFAPLEPYRARSLILDGLNMELDGTQHTCGYAALSCLQTLGGTPEGDGQPAGPSIDQFIAQQIGQKTPIKSLLFGASKLDQPTHTDIFASGAGAPEEHFQSPAAMFQRLFGSLPKAPTGGAPPVNKERVLMDLIRKDISKLQANLAGIERRKLDDYLAVIEEHETRLKDLPALTCDLPAMAGDARYLDTAFSEDKLEAMVELATLSLVCGATNVVGISATCGHGHESPTRFGRIHKEAGSAMFNQEFFEWPGHPTEEQGEDSAVKMEAARILYPFLSKQMASMIEGMSKVGVGGKTLFDNSTLIFGGDNGVEHHDDARRWPMLVVGNAGGGLNNVDGRYRRFGDRSCTQNEFDNSKEPRLADFFCTLATALGAPTTTFGSGPNLTTGSIPELVGV